MLLNFLRRKRVRLAKTTFVHGETFTPGAMAWQPVSDVADPVFVTRVDASRNFNTLKVGQTPPAYQNYVVPNAPTTGTEYNAPDPSNLLALEVAYDGAGLTAKSEVYG